MAAPKIIYKYQIKDNVVLLPASFKLLKVGTQTGGIFVWGTVNPDDHNIIGRPVVVVPTGADIGTAGLEAAGFQYLDTVIDTFNMLVWHIYEDRENPISGRRE